MPVYDLIKLRNNFILINMKHYKVGDRIFYECFDGSIESSIVIDIKEESYLDDRERKHPYQWLILWKDGNCSSGIEDYNCLSPSNPKCRELAKKFAKFDKQKDSIMNSLLNILSPWEKEIQEQIIELLKIQLKVNR